MISSVTMTAIVCHGALLLLLWWTLTESRRDGWVMGLVAIGCARQVTLTLCVYSSGKCSV